MRYFALAAIAMLAACAPQRPIPRAVPQSANPGAIVALEIAFAREAKEKGEIATFRKYAAKDATVFRPQPVSFLEYSAADKDKGGKATQWQPHKVFMSCDGRTAVSSGAWQTTAENGYFTTVWQWFPSGREAPMQQGTGPDGEWRWILRHTNMLTKPLPRAEMIETKVASCKGRANAPLMAPPEGAKMKMGLSRDQSLNYTWVVLPDNSRTLEVSLWDGTGFETLVMDSVPEPKP
jgi:hypothetical protein